MQWSPQQDAALLDVQHWLRCVGGNALPGRQQVYRLFGYAGTGKTTLARHLAADVKGRVEFCAYTGKAARVLREKGCPASTIHKLIYVPREKSRKRLLKLEQAYAEATDEAQRRLLWRQMQEEKVNLSRPQFSLNTESGISEASLIVVDEASMVDERVGQDLLSFGVPILALGDPAQLPPVRGEGFFMRQDPDTQLTEIHRQASDNPIIRLASLIRRGEKVVDGTYGESLVCSKRRTNPEDLRDLALEADQIIVGRNATRRATNKRVRQIRGREGLVEDGEKLVCLRNNHDLGLLNGSIWHVDRVESVDDDFVVADLVDDDGVRVTTSMHAHHFRSEEVQMAWWDRKENDEFDFGYALTCHKSQGSQWDSVYVMDESRIARKDAKRWLYTAVTRAAEKVVLVR